MKEDLRPALLYCRESRDEDGIHYERIETQRDVLLDFCRRRGITNIVDIVMDDHVSGTSLRRLGGILRRVERGEIHYLIFKDSSRLGRNLRQSLAFVDQVEELGGEILFADETYSEDLFPLQAWFNERRAREDSQKIRAVLRHKMTAGTLLVRPHYGYRRSGGGMVPCEETAAVVRRIFAAADCGFGAGEIARRLNEEDVPTPSRVQGMAKAAEQWNAQHIRRILANDVYLGIMTHHKTSRKSYKNRTTVRHDPQDWIVLENHHPPLVAPELFERVNQGKMRAQKAARSTFSGFLVCGGCGSTMVLRRRKGRRDTYICGRYHRYGTAACTPHSVAEETLRHVITAFCTELLRESPPDMAAVRERFSQKMTAEEEMICRQLRELRLRQDGLYEDLKNGLLGEESFLRLREKYAARERQLLRQEARRPRAYEEPFSVDSLMEYFEKNFPDRTLWGMLISRIRVCDPEEGDIVVETRLQTCPKGLSFLQF